MKRKTLTTALLAGLTGTVGIANMSNAVNINPDGLGQALVYPYYTVRDGQDTLISVVNTTDSVKAVKVRFLEAENSREVLDFNLFLSPFDVWTAAVVDNGTGAAIFSQDTSCTVPDVPDTFGDAQPFLDFRYTDQSPGGEDFRDGGSTTLDRTREGYLEMLEMGVVTDASGFATAATHVAQGGTLDCATLRASDAIIGGDVIAPTGGLFGGGAIVDVFGGTFAGYNADAIDNWSAIPQYSSAGDEEPRLSDANSGVGDVTTQVFYQGTVVTSDWATGAEAVSAIYMHDNIMNEYVLDDVTNSGTDWVVTFPTKRFHTDSRFSVGTVPVPPFTTSFSGGIPGQACEEVTISVYDREETPLGGGQTGPIFSPAPPGQPGDALCFEANVMTFDSSSVLSSALDSFTNLPVNFQNGWANIAFTDTANQMSSNDGDTYFGLPSTGFAVQEFVNGTLEDSEGNSVLSNYQGLFDHRATRCIEASAEAATCPLAGS
jgi:hypothetical protein